MSTSFLLLSSLILLSVLLLSFHIHPLYIVFFLEGWIVFGRSYWTTQNNTCTVTLLQAFTVFTYSMHVTPLCNSVKIHVHFSVTATATATILSKGRRGVQ